jgi:hypothetical protein
MIVAVLQVPVHPPAGFPYQGCHLIGRKVVLRPPGCNEVPVADPQDNPGRSFRGHRIADQNSTRQGKFGQPGQQAPVTWPGTTKAEVPARQQYAGPGQIGRRFIEVTQADIGYAATAA